MTTYGNPHWPEYGPIEYSTTNEPEEYRGYLIYVRLDTHNVLPGPVFVDLRVWDVVKDGEYITSMAGPNGARQAIDKLLDSNE